MAYKEKISAAYILTHIASKKEYVGSTGHIKQRINEHLSQLNNSRHRITELQKLFNEDKRISIEFLPTSNREEAFDLEQKLLDERKDKLLLLNKSNNSRTNLGVRATIETRLKMSLARTGSKRSDETKKKMSESAKDKVVSEESRQKMRISQKLLAQTEKARQRLLKNAMSTAKPITINNVTYQSIRDASRKLKLNRNTIKKFFIK